MMSDIPNKNTTLKKDIISVVIVSFFLLVYCVLIQFPSTLKYALMMWMLSPIMIIVMVYSVIRHGSYNGPDLGDKEYGYCDKL